jgi:hypothetical protein
MCIYMYNVTDAHCLARAAKYPLVIINNNNSVALVRSPLVGEVSVNFCGYRAPRCQRRILTAVFSVLYTCIWNSPTSASVAPIPLYNSHNTTTGCEHGLSYQLFIVSQRSVATQQNSILRCETCSHNWHAVLRGVTALLYKHTVTRTK